MTEMNDRQRDFSHEVTEVDVPCLYTDTPTHEPSFILATPSKTYAIRTKQTKGWNISLNAGKLAKLYQYCAGTQLTPAIAFKYTEDADWLVAPITNDTPAVAAGGLKLTHRQTHGIAEPIGRLADGHKPSPLERASIVDRYHASRISLNDETAPKPDWAGTYITQNGNPYYEVPVKQDHYQLHTRDPADIPDSVDATWSRNHDDGTTHYATADRDTAITFLRNRGILSPTQEDSTLRDLHSQK